jgi:hypothetical protein
MASHEIRNPRTNRRRPFAMALCASSLAPYRISASRRAGQVRTSRVHAWRRIDDGATMLDSARLHEAPADWLPPPPDESHVRAHVSHKLNAANLHGEGNEQMHHHSVPAVPHRGQQVELDSKKLPSPSLKVISCFPQTLAAGIKPALASLSVAGPVWLASASMLFAIVIGAIAAAGHLVSNAEAHVPAEAPLFSVQRRSWFTRRGR